MNKQDAAAFLHRRMSDLYGYCLRRCASIQDAQDTTQEILLRAWQMLTIREDLTDPERCLWVVARNTLINHYRQRTRCTVGVPAEAVDPEDFEAGLLAQEELRRLHGEVARLSRQQREIVVLHYFHRMTHEQIARTLSLPVGTVKWHLHQAKKELKQHMEITRPVEHLKFDPVRFTGFGTEGSTGADGSPWRVFRSSLAQNIAYACWRKARTVQEIADALGVSPVYIADETERMVHQGYLSCEKGRLRSEILLTETTADLIRLSDRMYEEAARLIAPALVSALDKAEVWRDEGLYIPRSTEGEVHRRSYALWALIPWMVANAPSGDDHIPFREVATLRPDGAHNLCHATITPPGTPLPGLAGKMERFSGPCWNEQEGVSLWQIDTAWSEARVGEMLLYTEPQVLSLIRRELEGGDLSQEDSLTLVRRGVLRTEGDPEGLFYATLLPVWLRGKPVREKLISLAQEVYANHREALESLREPYAGALLADTPAHLQRLQRYMLQGVFRSGFFILRCLSFLSEAGMLLPPTQEEKRSLHMVILSE